MTGKFARAKGLCLADTVLFQHRNGGWGRGRGDSLAELGITEEEFEEYAQRKPRGENPEAGTLAMGMDVDFPRQGGSRSGKLTESCLDHSYAL